MFDFFKILEWCYLLRGEINVKISKNRTARKQQQIEVNQFFEDSEGLLYGPGIAD